MSTKQSVFIRIRRAVRDDSHSIASVLHESFVEYESLYTRAAFEATTPKADQVRTRFGEGPTWVALRNGKVVGTVSAVAMGEALYVRSLAVAPVARGQRVGHRLMGHVEKFAVKDGFKRMSLSTTPFLAPAIALYKREGFRRVSKGPHDRKGTRIFTMEKILKYASKEKSRWKAKPVQDPKNATARMRRATQ